MESCLSYDPENRATCTELLGSSYFETFGVDFEPELQEMLGKDAAEFAMKRKKVKKGRGGSINSGDTGDLRDRPTSRQQRREDKLAMRATQKDALLEKRAEKERERESRRMEAQVGEGWREGVEGGRTLVVNRSVYIVPWVVRCSKCS